MIKILWVEDQAQARENFYLEILENNRENIMGIYEQYKTYIEKEVEFNERADSYKRIQLLIKLFDKKTTTSNNISQFYEEIHKLIGFEVTFVPQLNKEHLKSTDYHLIISDNVGVTERGGNAYDFIIKHKDDIKIPFVIYSASKNEDQVNELRKKTSYFYGWYLKGSTIDYKNLLNAIKQCSNAGTVKQEYFKILNVFQLLHLFLPLDIDMQALAIIHKVEDKKRADKDILDYLINSKEPQGMLRNRSGYKAKLTEALDTVKKVKELKNKEDIQNLLEARKGFLEMLDKMKVEVGRATSENAAKATVNNYLNSKENKFWENVNSFHAWYCALAECLRGEEACK